MKRVLTFGTPALAVVAAVFLSPGIVASPNAVDQSSTGGGQAPASIAASDAARDRRQAGSAGHGATRP